MARMSREFTLVLLGAGLLTAGYFVWPDDDPAKKAEEQNNPRQGGGGHGRTYYGTHVLILPGRSGGSPISSGASSRGGFGTIGRAFSGGS